MSAPSAARIANRKARRAEKREAGKRRGLRLPAPAALDATPPALPRLEDAPPGSLSGGGRICLSMIVRNEAHVIRRALASVRPLISSYAIVDTGSTDGTQDVIREFMKDIPGTLIERDWENFATGRSQALDLARESGADWALVIDADDWIEPSGYEKRGDRFVLPRLPSLPDAADVIVAPMVHDGQSMARPLLVRLASDLRWRDRVHTNLARPDGAPACIRTLDTYRFRIGGDGGRTRRLGAAKREETLRVLNETVERGEASGHTWFHLAIARASHGDHRGVIDAADHALAATEQLSEGHRYWCALLRAEAFMRLGAPTDEVIDGFERARALCPERAEAPRWLARNLEQRGEHPDLVKALHAAADEKQAPSVAVVVDMSAYARAESPRREPARVTQPGPPKLEDAAPGSLAGPHRIALSLICRDEAHVIRRALRSVRPFLTSWAVVDTGSVDDTRDVVREELAGIPGKLIERPWENFATARSEALDLARETGATFALIVDCDDFWQPAGYHKRDGRLVLGELPKIPDHIDAVTLTNVSGALRWDRFALVRLNDDLRWVGAVHERIVKKTGRLQIGHVREYTVAIGGNGGRTRRLGPAKNLENIKLLEGEASSDAATADTWFHLLTAYASIGRHQDAVHAAERVLTYPEVGAESRYWCLIQRSSSLAALGAPTGDVVSAFDEARALAPERAEAPRWLARVLERRRERPDLVAELHAAADRCVLPVLSPGMVDASAYRARAYGTAAA